MNFILFAIAGLLAGMIGAMGIGGGGILIIFLTLFGGITQIGAQGINLLFFIPVAVFSVWIYVKKGVIDKRVCWFTALFGIAGAVLGAYLSTILGGDMLRKIFGLCLIAISVKELFSKAR